MPYLFVIGIVHILFGRTFSLFSVFWLVCIGASWKIFKFLWGFKFLKSLKFLIIFLLSKKVLIVMILTLILWGIKYVSSLYLHLFLTLFFFKLFWHVCGYKVQISSWTYVLEDQGYSKGTCQERHAKDMLIGTCWRAKCGDTVQRIFLSWFTTYCIYVFFMWCRYEEALCKF